MADWHIPGLVRCGNCGFVTANINLSDDELRGLYGEKYFCGEEYADYIRDRSTIERSFLSRLRTLLPYVSRPETKHLFEIGAAHGFFLNLARPSFGSVSGIDVSSFAAEFARREFGLDVQCGDLLNKEVEGDIDVACLWDTIEHLRHPDLYVEWLSGRMQSGSAVAITTGDIESYVARWRGAKWRQIHPPTHLHYFSVRSLTRLLNNYGFRVKLASHDGMYRSVDMMAYIILCRRHQHTGIYRALKSLGILNWDLYMNLRDIMFVIAEKTG